jgi:phosphoglycerol transferase MdoB-like AlkP superfamily enzyme
MKNVILFILALLLAIASTVGVIFLLRLQFQDFEWEYGFSGFIVSLFAFIFRIVNIVNLFAYAVCLAAWCMTIDLCVKVFGSKETEKKQSYTKYKKYHGTPSNSWNDLTDMQGPDDDEDKSYLYEDMIPDNDDTDR